MARAGARDGVELARMDVGLLEAGGGRGPQGASAGAAAEEEGDEGEPLQLDLQLAQVHGENSKIEKKRFGAVPCPCGECDFKDGGEPYSLFCQPEDLAPLGTGWVLFFDFAKFVVALLLFYQMMYFGIMSFSWTVNDGQERLSSFSLLYSRSGRDLNGSHWEDLVQNSPDIASVALSWATAGNWGPARDLFPRGLTGLCDRMTADKQASGTVHDFCTAMEFPWPIYYHYICLLGTIAAVSYQRKRQVVLALRARERSVTASDYSVLLENLPSDCRKEIDVMRMVHRVLGSETDDGTWEPLRDFDEDGCRQVVRVVFAFDISRISRDLEQLHQMRAELRRRVAVKEGFTDPKKAKEWRKETRRLRAAVHNSYGRVVAALEKSLQARAAIVTMRKPHLAENLIEALRLPALETWFRQVLPLCCQPCFFPKRPGALGTRGHVVIASKPPDPSDILWESFGPMFTRRVLRKALAFTLSLGLLCSVTIVMQMLTRHTKSGKDRSKATAIGVAVLVQVVNLLYPYVCERLVLLMKPKTRTEKRCSEMWRISLFVILNTVVVGFYVHAQHVDVLTDGGGHTTCNPGSNMGKLFPVSSSTLGWPTSKLWGGSLGWPAWLPTLTSVSEWLDDKDKTVGLCVDWYSKGHLADDTIVLVISSIFLSPTLVAISPALLRSKLCQMRYKKCADLTTTNMTQRQLNEVFEGPEPALPYRYAHLLNMLALSITFVPILPMVPGLAAIGLVVFYGANKYFLLRHAKTPYFQRHYIGFRALDLIWMIILPQPTIMCLLLSPSVDLRASMWRTVGPATITLAFACVVGRSYSMAAAWGLDERVRDYATCDKMHNMEQMSVSDFHKKFEGHNIDNACLLCGGPLDPEAGSAVGPSDEAPAASGELARQREEDGHPEAAAAPAAHVAQVYNCEVCAGMGMLYHLCEQCGMLQRKGGMTKDLDQPYEKAKKIFSSQYWKVCPLYSLFEDFFPWQESDLDSAYSNQMDFQAALSEGKSEVVQQIIVRHAESLGLEVARKGGDRKIRRYAAELVDGARKLVLQSEEELQALLSLLDEDSAGQIVRRKRIGGHVLGPGWGIQGKVPQPGDVDANGATVVEVEREGVTVAVAVEELRGEDWAALQEACGEADGQDAVRRLPSAYRVMGARTPTQSSKRSSQVACDWGTMAQDPHFQMLYGETSCECPRCARVFGSRALLVRHFHESNHDLVT